MKKLILLLLSVLLFIYIVFSLVSMRDGYSAERELWGIDRQLSFIATHEESTPDFTVDRLAKRYREYINKYSKTIFAKEAELMLGNLYALRKNYGQARIEYQKAISADKELSARAEVTIAKTYELEGNWDKALTIYKDVIRDYPLTNSGFFVPMYLANHDTAYPDALAFYQGIATKYPHSKIEYAALRMIITYQLKEKDWPGAVKTMGEIILKYPIAKLIQEAVRAINVLCVTKLHDYDAGIDIYRQFIQKYPDSPADPMLKKMIKDLQALKDNKQIKGHNT